MEFLDTTDYMVGFILTFKFSQYKVLELSFTVFFKRHINKQNDDNNNNNYNNDNSGFFRRAEGEYRNKKSERYYCLFDKSRLMPALGFTITLPHICCSYITPQYYTFTYTNPRHLLIYRYISSCNVVLIRGAEIENKSNSRFHPQ